MKVLEFLNSNFNILALAIMVLGLLVFVIMKAVEISRMKDILKKMDEIEHDTWWCHHDATVIKNNQIPIDINVRNTCDKLSDLFNSIESTGNYIRKTLGSINDQVSSIKVANCVTEDKIDEAVRNEVTIMNLLQGSYDTQDSMNKCLEAAHSYTKSIYGCLDAMTYRADEDRKAILNATKKTYKLMKSWGKVKNESN